MKKNYKRISIIITSAIFTFAVSHQTLAASPYVEGQFGLTAVSDVDTGTYSGTASGVTFTSVKGSIDYENAVTFGAEVGMRDFGVSNVRVGLSVNYFNAKLDSLTASGTATDGVTTLTGPATFSRADLNTIGAGSYFDNRVGLYSLNGYYDFNSDSKLTPYLGVGVGLADIENAKSKEWGISFIAGVNYDFTEKTYLGVKGMYHKIAGPTDKSSIKFDSITTYSIMATLGYNF